MCCSYESLNAEAVRILKAGGVGIIPTDTLYGIVASALDKKAVERVYRLRRRTPAKPFIILVSSVADLKKFSVSPAVYARKFLEKYWPGKVSIILPIANRKSQIAFSYLHRGAGSLAFRMPSGVRLRAFLKKTGPLIAPSANPEGKSPAKTVRQAKKYFGEKVDFYIDAGEKISKPSTLVKILNSKAVMLREGVMKISVL